MESLNNSVDRTKNNSPSVSSTKGKLKELISQESLQDVLIALVDICDEAHQANPSYDWDSDAKLIGRITPHISN
jgi:hypothetical protein